jgi:long-chain acyl-CoA synthetase
MASPSEPFRSANEVWADRVAKEGGDLAFRHKQGGAWVDTTWKQADVIAREIAAGLAAIGLQAGDRVCIAAQTRVEWMLSDVGILMAGAAAVPIYPSNTAEQCAFIVRDSGARAAVVEDPAQLEKLLPLLLAGADLQLVYIDTEARLDRADAKGRTRVALAEVLAGVPAEAGGRIRSLADLRAAGAAWLADDGHAAELERRRAQPGLQDTFAIIYTSGTTGNPKGVVLSHENLIAACTSATRALTLHDSDVQYLWLTMAHVLGMELAWVMAFVGAPTAFTEGVPKIKDNLTEIRPTFMAGVPRVYEKFYSAVQAGTRQGSAFRKRLVAWALGVGDRFARCQREDRTPGGWLTFQHGLADKLVLGKLRAKLGLDRCRFLVSGSAPLAPEIAEFFHSTGLLILEGYGLTETMAAAFFNRLERYRFGTVGPALDVVEVRIADDGEVLMRGPSVFKRYHNNPAATAEAIDADGWFHSGDIGQIEDGFLRITDRKKDLIVLAVGKKVPPQMLENALKLRSPLISQVLVYGDRKPYCVALLTLTEEAVKKYGDGDGARAAASPEVKAALDQAVAALNATLASHETIKRYAVLPEDFSEANGQLTPSLKVKRKVAIERHRTIIDGLYGGAAPAAAASG